jgi:polyisoprenoid-binding protein YceI
MIKLTLAYLCLALVVLTASPCRSAEFALDPAAGTDSVYFRSTAKLEFIEGKTSNLSGTLQFDPTNPAAPVSGILQVDLRTLKTGIETRDRHMRERHLHTDQYPFAFFELTGVRGLPGDVKADTTYSAQADGLFYIHGVKRHLSADLEVTLSRVGEDAWEVQVRAAFSIKLDEYHINRPKALFLKLAETLELDVIFSARNELKATPITLPPWELVP